MIALSAGGRNMVSTSSLCTAEALTSFAIAVVCAFFSMQIYYQRVVAVCRGHNEQFGKSRVPLAESIDGHIYLRPRNVGLRIKPLKKRVLAHISVVFETTTSLHREQHPSLSRNNAYATDENPQTVSLSIISMGL